MFNPLRPATPPPTTLAQIHRANPPPSSCIIASHTTPPRIPWGPSPSVYDRSVGSPPHCTRIQSDAFNHGFQHVCCQGIPR